MAEVEIKSTYRPQSGEVKLRIGQDGRIISLEAADSAATEGMTLAKGSADSLLSLAESLNGPGGAHFEECRRMLDSYRVLSFVNSKDSPRKSFLLFELGEKEEGAEDAEGPARLQNLLDAVDYAAEAMLDSSIPSVLDAGELIYARFLKPEYENKSTDFFSSLFKCSRASYFRLQSRAVSYMSALIFGLFPPEQPQ